MLQALKQYLPQFPSQAKEEVHLSKLIEQDRTLLHTPDVMLLEQQAQHVVFLYCDRQERHPRALTNVEVLWEGQTAHPYLFWKHDLGKLSYPVATNAVPQFKRYPMLPIRGQVVKISTHGLVQLDREKQNRLHYRRMKVPITVKLQKLVRTVDRNRALDLYGNDNHLKGDYQLQPVTYTVPAWMYIGIAKYWTPLIDDGYIFKQGRMNTPNKYKHTLSKEQSYYHFPPIEYPT